MLESIFKTIDGKRRKAAPMMRLLQLIGDETLSADQLKKAIAQEPKLSQTLLQARMLEGVEKIVTVSYRLTPAGRSALDLGKRLTEQDHTAIPYSKRVINRSIQIAVLAHLDQNRASRKIEDDETLDELRSTLSALIDARL